jgi:glycosyltransferase involved in cell wall biosynthesis
MNLHSANQPAPAHALTDGSLKGGILITIHRLSFGGADRVAIYLANGFVAAGIPVGIASLRNAGEGERTLLGLLEKRVFQSSAGPPIGSRHLELARGLPYIRRLTALARPSVVLASSNNMGLITGLASMRQPGETRPSYVLKTTNPVIRPCDRSRLRKLYRRRLYGFVFSNFDRILTLGAEERDTLTRMYPRQSGKFGVATNPYITPEMLEECDQSPRSGPPTILTLARMMPQKRLDVLLVAFARVRRRDCRLTILGDGPERPRLKALAESLGIADRIEMPGFAEQVLPWLRNADLFVLSSDYEGLPAAVFEALACNVPVVTTDCFEGARSLLTDAAGSAVVPRGDVNALALAIDDSLSNRTRITSLRDIARGYEIEAGIESHLSALRPLLRRNGGANRS